MGIITSVFYNMVDDEDFVVATGRGPSLEQVAAQTKFYSQVYKKTLRYQVTAVEEWEAPEQKEAPAEESTSQLELLTPAAAG